jgi:hypothetical protein
VKRLAVAALTATAVLAPLAAAPAAAAAPVGCETIHWGFLGLDRRTICDSARLPDGSWFRAREVWSPAHQVPMSCSYSRYSSVCSGGYWQPRTSAGVETYPVNDGNVLPDEPGWLPTGTDVLR